MNVTDYSYYIVRYFPTVRVYIYCAIILAFGNKSYARAVGKYMNKNPNADIILVLK